MIINKISIGEGQKKVVKLSVSKLPSGTEIDILAHVFRSNKPGPTILVLGGLHGDEINGIEIVRKSINDGVFDKLKCGNVIAIPLLNVYGFINYSRDLPDGKDINRSFPGNSNGSLASRVAKQLTQHILPIVDFGIDFHTGGKSIHNVPQIRIDATTNKAEELANEFGAPFIIKSKLIPNSLRKECNKRGLPMLVFEGGESLRLDQNSIKVGMNGIKNILAFNKMATKPKFKKNSSITISNAHWVRATFSGIFEPNIKAGQYINKGDKLGVISIPYDKTIRIVKARKSGYIYGLNNNPVINQGDALVHIGE
ncbi:succinylglutamate desuccinylase/aspartoacylase family protein [Flavobacteriales bacterium]|nr:succinylglutamate desuccinylase/aspartoacylase family protein [Flavobacteriales bacterium]